MASHSPANSFLGGLDSSRRWTRLLTFLVKKVQVWWKRRQQEKWRERPPHQQTLKLRIPSGAFWCHSNFLHEEKNLYIFICQMPTPAAWYKKPGFQRWSHPNRNVYLCKVNLANTLQIVCLSTILSLCLSLIIFLYQYQLICTDLFVIEPELGNTLHRAIF